MSSLTKKLFNKVKAITPEQAERIGVKAYKECQLAEGSRLYAEIITVALVMFHNDFGFGKKRLIKLLTGIDEFMRGIKKYDGDVVAEARKVLKDECNLDVVLEYRKIRGQ